MWFVCYVYCRKPLTTPEVQRLQRQSLINFCAALVVLLAWYIYFALAWENLGAFGEYLIVVNPHTYWYTAA